MMLESSHGKPVSHPTDHDIEQALQSLHEEDGFVILAQASEEYVQATASVIEYRADGRHYQAALSGPTDADLRRVFVAYLGRDDAFRTLLPWRDITDELPTGTAPSSGTPTTWNPAATIAGVLVAALVLGGFLAWQAGWLG